MADATLDSLPDGNGAEGNVADSANEGAAGTDEGPVDETKAAKILVLLNEKLPEVINKQRADEFCVSFCYVATKSARKRLVQALFRVPRFRSELTVTYARVVASLTRIYPELAPALIDALKREFHGMLKTKHQQHVDGKIKTVRFLGELVKFRVVPPIVAFRMFRSLFGDFSNQNAQLLSILLETCGRFLYLLPYTHNTMNDILNTMLRLRRAKNLDLTMQTLLEAAYFAVKPPERVEAAKKTPLTPVQQYARYLVSVKLEEPRANVEDVIRCLRRLPLKNAEENVTVHVVKASLKVARSKYVSIPNLADCLSGLGEYHPNLVVIVVDRILEEVQRSLETPYKREIQRILGLVRLLGELYNFTAISSVIIFDLLFHLIEFDHCEVPATAVLVERATQLAGLSTSPIPSHMGMSGANSASTTPVNTTAGATPGSAAKPTCDPRIHSDLDPPGDLFRAQVVCELLNTCGMYFVKGKPKEKLTRFLVYFQRYLLTKQFIPLHVEFMILDTLDALEEQAQEASREGQRKPVGRGASKLLAQQSASEGPAFPRFDSMEAAQAAVETYEQVRSSSGGVAGLLLYTLVDAALVSYLFCLPSTPFHSNRCQKRRGSGWRGSRNKRR
jgi:regulator of nonsense transcripts 2